MSSDLRPRAGGNAASVAADLLQIVEDAHSLDRILESAARAVAHRLDVAQCLPFLIGDRGELSECLVASSGENAVAKADAWALANRVVTEGRVARGESGTSSLLGSPILLRGSPVGALLLLGAKGRRFTSEEVELLEVIAAHLAGIVETARIIDLFDRGKAPAPRATMQRVPLDRPGGERVLRGIAAAPGIAIGRALFHTVRSFSSESGHAAEFEPEAERARARLAFQKTHNDILRLQAAAAREIDEEHALIFASHLLILSDPMILEGIDRRISEGAGAGRAIDEILGEFEAQLRLVSDSYIRERVDDLCDVRSRLLGHLIDEAGRLRFGERIVISERLSPSLALEVKSEGAQALVSEFGGATSHAVLLSRALAIPTVTGIESVLDAVRPGESLIVDGNAGVVIADPGDDTVSLYREKMRAAEEARTEYARFRDVPAVTADGVRVVLHANVGLVSDLQVACDNGAEGIGLYRTEFPFLLRDGFPTVSEQVRIYRRAYDVFPGGPIHFRLLDLGGDKFITGGAIPASRDAFHGYRSIRVLFDHPEVLRDQVQALALAAGDRPLRILIPMITSIEELRRVKAMVLESLEGLEGPGVRKTPEFGAMIEVPAAVELASDIAHEVDFVSIGTNDLMQYALVVDREDSRLAQAADPYHPALLRMIDRVVRATHASGKTVGVCGEVAARPDIALALVALGVDTLSVVPAAIPVLKQSLAGARLDCLRRSMPRILSLPDSDSVAAALRSPDLRSSDPRDCA